MSCQSPCPTCGGTVSQIIPAPCTEENHSNESPAHCCCSKQYVEVSQSFNWPGVGDEVTLRACCAEGVAPGAVLYSLGLGYLHVESVPSECEIIAKNLGEVCNVKVAGEPVAAGQKLLVGVPPCAPVSDGGGGLSSANCLTTSFIVPEYCATPSESGACCVDVGVTSVIGLSAGDRLALGFREFRLLEIKTPNIIRICNDGKGGLPGTVVAAGDCFQVIDGGNVCAKTPVTDCGVLVVCKNGEQRPFKASFDNAIPQWRNVSGCWETVAAPPLPKCTSLICCLTVDHTNPDGTNYTIEVEDSSLFAVGNLVTISLTNGNLVYFSVVAIPDSTHLRVTPTQVPSETLEFEENAAICIVADACSNASIDFPDSGTPTLVACINGQSRPIKPQCGTIIQGCCDDEGKKLWKMAPRGLSYYPFAAEVVLESTVGVHNHDLSNVMLANGKTVSQMRQICNGKIRAHLQANYYAFCNNSAVLARVEAKVNDMPRPFIISHTHAVGDRAHGQVDRHYELPDTLILKYEVTVMTGIAGIDASIMGIWA